MKRTIVASFIGAVVLLAAVSPAAAICSPPKSFGSTDFQAGRYVYLYLDDVANDSVGPNITGTFYEPGAGKTLNNNGTYNVADWLDKYYPGTDYWYVAGNWGSAGVAGCASGAMTIEIFNSEAPNTDPRGSFIKITTAETAGRLNVFDFSTCVGLNAAPAPAYKVTTSGRSGTIVNTTGTVASATAGEYSCEGASNPATAINIYTIASATTPSNDVAAGWTLAATAPAGGGTVSVDADCADTAVDVWVAAGIVGGADPITLGPATQIECDPTLADPRIKPIDRPGNFDRIRSRSR